ncbi:ATPase [Ornithinibacillus sp. L9]|uniref:ATPase n=1 Tax=Ornithinibacillus caprae TaxID=2678566 RepID=A0A6N8FIC8_9BACI|nr:SRPBCC domain-containing protein [Ornithinibacillus caprae]MUK88436.1 ATPase [Ornithinibacillus caprae]
MKGDFNNKRIDSVSRVVHASPQSIYKVFLDPIAWSVWLPPKGMKGKMYEFDASDGGFYHMILTYDEPDNLTQGKTTKDTDEIKGRFLKFIPNKRVVQLVEFESDNPIYAGEMMMTWSLTAVSKGTQVSIVCENVPKGIRKEDHEVGLASTLENLEDYMEGKLTLN